MSLDSRLVPGVVLALAASATLVAAQEKALDDYVWNLGEIYPDDAAWEAERGRVDSLIVQIEAMDPADVDTAEELGAVLAVITEARGIAGKMAKVGLLESEVASSDPVARARRDEGRFLETRVASAASFLEPLVRDLGSDTIYGWLEADASLKPHSRRLNRILRLAPYAAPPGMDGVSDQYARLSITASDFYGALLDSELVWEAAPEGSGFDAMTPAAYRRLSRHQDAELRRRGAEAYLTGLAKYGDLFALALTRRVEGDVSVARLHGLDDTTDRILTLSDGFDPQTYPAMFTASRNATAELAAAADALERVLDVEQLHYTDILATPSGFDRDIPVHQAVDLVLESVTPLGPEYRALLAERFEAGWLHLPPLEDKSFTVGVFWQVGGGHPHGMMPYLGDFRSARTLGATALLMMGYASVPAENPPDLREEDLPVYSNALWYLGRQLFDEQLLRTELTDDERISVLSAKLMRVIQVQIRFALIAEFEAELSRRVAAGDVLDGAAVSSLYLDLMKAYFEDAGIVVSDYLATEWVTHSTQFYGPHYATWAAANASALALKAGIRRGDEALMAVVRDGIGRSDSFFSADILRDAGVDLGDPVAYAPVIAEMTRLTEELNAALDARRMTDHGDELLR